MNTKKYNAILLSMILLLSITIVSCCTKKTKQAETATNGLRVCPDEWIQNKMPGPDSQQTNEYFILDGKRREIKEFDMEWLKKNCDIKPQIVY